MSDPDRFIEAVMGWLMIAFLLGIGVGVGAWLF